MMQPNNTLRRQAGLHEFSTQFVMFVQTASGVTTDWDHAFDLLNACNMFDILRALDAVHDPRTPLKLRDAKVTSGAAAFPRIAGALQVVLDGTSPDKAFAGVTLPAGELQTAQNFLSSYDGGARPMRLAVVETALAEWAKSGDGKLISAKESSGRDGGGELRKGWERLWEYFQKADETHSDRLPNKAAIQYLNRGADPRTTVFGSPHWCGIFAFWAEKTAGVSLNDWNYNGKWTSGNESLAAVRPPKAGDIGYRQAANHHCVIAEMNEGGNRIISIDGNSGTNSIITVSSFKAWSDYTAFYSPFKSRDAEFR